MGPPFPSTGQPFLPSPMATEMDILVVDDEAPIRMLWERFLTRWGYSFALAENGQQALDKARATHFDLLITDLTMPVMSGNELIYILRREQPNLEMIVTTGHGTIEVAVELMKAGVFDFITKPISFNHAELIIKKCLEQVHAREENIRLRQINKDLEALNEIKEKFIAITNHELRTPVSVLTNIVEILSQEMKGHDMEPMIKMVDRSTRQLAEIVGQMHEISRAKSNRLELQMSRFPVREVCDEVLEEFSLVLERRKHTVECDLPVDVAAVGDRAMFKKVVRELVQNAIKFTRDGGKITVTAKLEAERLLLSVSDTGIGIPADQQPRIFELFYEVGDSLHHHTSKDDFLGGGMGVGLSIVNDIMQAHEGEVSVISEVGRGSTFTVAFPLTPAGDIEVSHVA
jgi:signal transduction histidine kinase